MQMSFVFLLALSVATLVAALPFGEETLVEVHAEAQAEVNSLLAAGKTEQACRSLAKSDIDAVKEAVKSSNKMLKALSSGKDCANKGQKAVKAAKKELKKAKKDLKNANTAEEKALNKPLEYKVNFGAVKDDECVVHKTDSDFTKAKNAYDKAVKAHQKAKGAKGQAETNLKNAEDQAKKDVQACLCKTQKAHKDAWKTANENNAANQKAFTKGKHMLCVLDGKSLSKCPAAKAPKPTEVKMIKAIEEAKCEAGIKWITAPKTNTWEEDKKLCAESGRDLCKKAELCPAGKAKMQGGGSAKENQWTAIKDHNQWVYNGPAGGSYCHDHPKGPPTWGNQRGPFVWRSTDVPCC
jgi:hypothetical protein